MLPNDYVDRWIQYPKMKKVKITKINIACGYPEFFPTYYEVYYIDNDIEKHYVNLPESDFNESNPIFTPINI